jgi:Na+-translocating ferredoxin:NAD+ oxidoreductase RnfG subunit
MRKLMLILALVTCLAGPLQADDNPSLDNKIAKAVKVQGTVVGENIVPSAILDDLIARVGDTFLIDEASGRLVAKLGNKELDDHPANLQVKIVSILHGNVIISHLDVNISLLARP